MGTLRRVIPEVPPLDAVALRGEVGPCCTYAARGLYSPRYISLITPDPRGENTRLGPAPAGAADGGGYPSTVNANYYYYWGLPPQEYKLP